jgi:YD repeat-containing protein
VGPAVDVPPLLSTLLANNLVRILSVNRDDSGNVVIALNVGGIALNLDYNAAGQLTGADALGINIPIVLL